MNTNSLLKEFHKIVLKNNPKTDYLDTVKKVENSNAKYKGKAVPFLYNPMFFTQDDITNFEKITDKIMGILNKVIDRYINYPEFRKKFDYPKLLEELILLDHGYNFNVPMARFDVFYKDYENFKFCEFNTDGSSAMNEDNTLARIFLEGDSVKEMGEKYNINYIELIYKWVDESISIFKGWNKDIDKPNVAIVDFEGSGTPAEFQEFKKAYIDKGYNAYIVDPRDLKYTDGKLYFNDIKIDLIYRRIVTREFIERSHEIRDLINAYREGAVCLVGPIRSQIPHNKIIFKILHEEDTLEFLDKEEREYIKKHIPYTKEFKDNKDLIKEALNNKNKYVLKPKDLFASKGVYVGKDYDDKSWKVKVEGHFNKDYLLQEFCVPYKRDIVEYTDGEFKVNSFNQILGLYIYREKFAGLYNRVGKNNIISGLHGCYTLPNLIVEDKNVGAQ
ncbi:glutathionylspermidine synthase family protein [Dethiothermospora halolimnae]|uniref:glutathionylspermidine synthase family protein n=1 Tax=Dethiothermospora halolimnae TaxID=3114390 RepID=UPI003CCB9C21